MNRERSPLEKAIGNFLKGFGAGLITLAAIAALCHTEPWPVVAILFATGIIITLWGRAVLTGGFEGRRWK